MSDVGQFDLPTENGVVKCPYQAFLDSPLGMTPDYAKNVMAKCTTGVVQETLQPNDTIIVASDGVFDNINTFMLQSAITQGYAQNLNPQSLAENLVKQAMDGASLPGGKPDDIIAAVGYVVRKW